MQFDQEPAPFGGRTGVEHALDACKARASGIGCRAARENFMSW